MRTLLPSLFVLLAVLSGCKREAPSAVPGTKGPLPEEKKAAQPSPEDAKANELLGQYRGHIHVRRWSRAAAVRKELDATKGQLSEPVRRRVEGLAYQPGFRTGGRPVMLLPISADLLVERADAGKVWEGLFAGIVTDDASVKLLARLFGGARAQIVAGRQGGSGRPRDPADGFDMVLRVQSGPTSRMEAVNRAGRRVTGLQGTIDYEMVSPSGLPVAGDRVYKAFFLAAEDYLLRQRGGWALLVGLFTEMALTQHLAGSPRTLAERRAELDNRLEQFATGSRGAMERWKKSGEE